MGLFDRNRDDEFLDEDEKRLIRESKARNRKAHSGCAADHFDDGRFEAPVTNPRSHDDCKADHSDDNPSRNVYRAPQNQAPHSNPVNNPRPVNNSGSAGNPRPSNIPGSVNGTRPSGSGSPYNQNPYSKTQDNGNIRRAILVIVGVMTFSIFVQFAAGMFSVFSGFKKASDKRDDARRRMESVEASIREESKNMESSAEEARESMEDSRDFAELQMIITRIYGSGHYSRSQLIELVMEETNCSRSEVEDALAPIEVSGVFDYSLNAVFYIREMDPDREFSEEQATDVLREAGFTSQEVENALENYYN